MGWEVVVGEAMLLCLYGFAGRLGQGSLVPPAHKGQAGSGERGAWPALCVWLCVQAVASDARKRGQRRGEARRSPTLYSPPWQATLWRAPLAYTCLSVIVILPSTSKTIVAYTHHRASQSLNLPRLCDTTYTKTQTTQNRPAVHTLFRDEIPSA